MIGDGRDWLERHHGERTLLGVCPMTEEIVTATIREADRTGFPPMFIATPRQVDADRGYTGWSQRDLAEFVESVCDSEGYDGSFLLARDHGGPYQSRRDRGDASVALETAMEYATELFAADLRAGFDVLHVDATADPRTDGPLSLSEIAHRTVELVDAIETERRRIGESPVYYEVGTEEIAGGMTEPEDFDAFLDLLEEELSEVDPDLPDRVVFAVGQVGTRMNVDMTNDFSPGKTADLVERADAHGVFLKTHFTDWLPTETLERFPELGVGAANVGPEFAAALAEALVELERREVDLLEDAGDLDRASGFTETFERAAIADAPWEKYADDLHETDRDTFVAENRRNIALCVGRYVLSEPTVAAARERLYANLNRYGTMDPDEVLVECVRESIARYVEAFDL